MEILALNANFENLGALEYINLMWERSYYSYGTFLVQIRASDYDPRMTYIYCKDRPETGMIQKVRYSSQINGRFVELSGFFIKKMLDDKVAWPTFFANGNIETEIRRLISTYKADISRLTLGPVAGLGSSGTWQDTGGGLGEICCERLQAQQLAYQCQFNDQDGLVYFSVWQGKDRTQTQSENAYAVFSDEFQNLGNVEIVTDDSNLKNYAYVAGEGQSEERIVVASDNSGGGYKRQVWIDSRHSRFNPDEQTLAQYRADLRQDGFDDLANKFYKVENAQIGLFTAVSLAQTHVRLQPIISSDEKALVYMRDYDLGDKCETLIHEMGLDIQARIILVQEVVKSNQHIVNLELGDTILTRTEKARI